MKISALAFLAFTLMVTLLVSMMFGAHFTSAQSGTNVIGMINKDTAWTRTNSPYVLAGPVAVNIGVTLTIEPGAVVDFGEYYLQVNGTLTAIGTTTDPIQLNGGSIYFMQPSISWNEQTSTGCIIENANVTAEVNVSDASPKIDGNTIIGVIWITGGDPVISNDAITSQIQIDGGSPTIFGCIIHGAISTDDNGQLAGFPVISNNQITGSITIVGSPTITNKVIDGTIDYTGYDGSVVITNNTITSTVTQTVLTFAGEVTEQVREPSIGLETYHNYNVSILDNNLSEGSVGINRGGGVECSVIVENNIITNETVGIALSTVTLVAKNNQITGCTDGIDATANAALTIQNNDIANNNGNGIQLINSPTSPTISFNNIENNTVSIKLTNTANDINATYNWWGTTDAQAINQTIYDSKNDFNLGTVNFVPFLTAPNPQATTYIPTLTQSLNSSSTTASTSTTISSSSPSSSPAQKGANTTSFLPTALMATGIVTTVIVAVAIGAFLLGKRAERKSARLPDYQI